MIVATRGDLRKVKTEPSSWDGELRRIAVIAFAALAAASAHGARAALREN
jgi:hypothetical protein